jgi:hypothetical protein
MLDIQPLREKEGLLAKARRRRRRTDEERFIDELSARSEDGTRLVSNVAMRDALDWTDEKYARVKEQLELAERLVVGRGRGGTVGLKSPPGTKALSIFISYSHADEDVRNALVKHLEPLKRMNLVSTWDDRQIAAGGRWDREISEALNTADIVLLLVSIDFINSEYCYDIELQRALTRQDEGSARVIPIICRSCLWQHAPFAKLQALPGDARPIDTWPTKDEPLTSVADAIRGIASEMLAKQ